MSPARIAIVGAGMAGLACATALKRKLPQCTLRLFDKGRGPGGRVSSRRTDAGRFDHGAPFFTARSEDFRACVRDWHEEGVIADWHPRLAPGGRDDGFPDGVLVGLPSMSAILKAQVAKHDVLFGTRIAPLAPDRRNGRHLLRSETGEPLWDADLVVCALPAEQAAEFLGEASPPLAKPAEAVVSTPILTAMLALAEKERAPSHDLFRPASGPIDLAVREDTKPGRDGQPRYTVHATHEWSTEMLECEIDENAAELSEAFTALAALRQPARIVSAHRWRYARPARMADIPFGVDEDASLATCGDWHNGRDIESAWQSGHALGSALSARV